MLENYNSASFVLPHSEQAEKSVLSVLLQQPERITAALGDGLTDDHFHSHANKGVWNEITAMHREGLEVELISLVERLRHSGRLETLGGAAEVTGIYTYVPTAAHWSQHMDILRDRLARREMIRYASSAGESAAGDGTPEELAAGARKAADSLMQIVAPATAAKTARDACKEFNDHFLALAQSDKPPGTPTGLDQLDHITGGVRPGELWVISGPTSGGKSVLCLQAAHEALSLGKKVGVFSLEMGAEENIARLVSCGYGVDYGRLRNPRAGQPMVKGEIEAIKRALADLGNSHLTIWDEGGMTVERVESLAVQWKDMHGLDMLVVDYIQLLTTTGAKGEGRARELALISANLKQLAKKLHCPVVTGSQLNDEGKLRESRAIGQDADVVLRIEGEAGIYVLKNRNGAKHMHLPYELDGVRQKFTDVQGQQSPTENS